MEQSILSASEQDKIASENRVMALKDKLSAYGKVKGGIFHLLAVREMRRCFGEDDEMHVEKLIRRLLSADLKAYLLDPELKRSQELKIDNPYRLTDITEDEWKALEALKILRDALTGRPVKWGSTQLSGTANIEKSIEMIDHDNVVHTIGLAFGDKNTADRVMAVVSDAKQKLAEKRGDDDKSYYHSLSDVLTAAIGEIEAPFQELHKTIKSTIADLSPFPSKSALEEFLSPQYRRAYMAVEGNRCKINEYGLAMVNNPHAATNGAVNGLMEERQARNGASKSL